MMPFNGDFAWSYLSKNLLDAACCETVKTHGVNPSFPFEGKGTTWVADFKDLSYTVRPSKDVKSVRSVKILPEDAAKFSLWLSACDQAILIWSKNYREVQQWSSAVHAGCMPLPVPDGVKEEDVIEILIPHILARYYGTRCLNLLNGFKNEGVKRIVWSRLLPWTMDLKTDTIYKEFMAYGRTLVKERPGGGSGPT